MKVVKVFIMNRAQQLVFRRSISLTRYVSPLLTSE
jgi:hypothetical protein